MRYVLIFRSQVGLSVIALFNLSLVYNAESEIDLALRNAEALSIGEGGNSHTLKCKGTLGWCNGKCNIHQVEMSKTGKDDDAVFTCSG